MERIDRAVLAAFVAAVVVTCGVVGVVVADSRDTAPLDTRSTEEPGCAVDRGVLPEWARTGFSEPEPKIAGPQRLTAVQGGRRVTRVVESGPGPSSVDLPEGCWRISARWPGGEDELELRYRAG